MDASRTPATLPEKIFQPMTSYPETSAPMTSGRPCVAQSLDAVQSTVPRLVRAAAAGVVQMFDRTRQLFCYRLKKTDRGLVQEGISRRYTVITLLGLHRFEQAGFASPIDTKPVLRALLANTSWVNNVGDLGLLLWLCALSAPENLAELDSRLDVTSALRRYRDARKGLTMELAWFLSGLCHWALAQPAKLADLQTLAFTTYGMLQSNRGKAGLFGHASKGSTAGWIRGKIGSLADQLYPVYAMTKLSEAYGDDGAAKKALDCARVLCATQGPLGQWWWHYDASSGRVVQGYPVFSVHQHGMVPMTLLALGDALQVDFSPWIYKGLRWIHSENELGFDMEDVSANVIWRSIYQPTFKKLWNAALNAGMGREETQSCSDDLRILFECRPYELGWLLYAFAGRIRNQRSLLTVKEQIADVTTADTL